MKSKHYYLEPVKEWHTDDILKSSGNGDNDLAITRLTFDSDTMPNGVMSVWKCDSIWARFIFLFTGKVNFIAMGVTHPPIMMNIGTFLKKPKKGKK